MEIANNAMPRIIRDFFKSIPNCGIENLSDARKVATIVDNKYSSVEQSEVIESIKTNPLLVTRPESAENHELVDCDDYALQLKASLTALYRARLLSDPSQHIFPPAIGIVITQNHALNLVLCSTSDEKPKTYLIDSSLNHPEFIDEPSLAATALKKTPIVLIYI